MNVLEIFKNNAMNNKDAIVATCKAYKKALAEEDRIIKKQEEIQNNILKNFVFYTSAENANRFEEKVERIIRPFDTYMMSEEDFKEYEELCYGEFVRAGIANPKGIGWVCEEFAKKERQICEDNLLDLMRKIVPCEMLSITEFVNMKNSITYRKKLIDRALDLEKLECIN